MKALLRSSILGLVVFAGFTAFSLNNSQNLVRAAGPQMPCSPIPNLVCTK